MATGRAASRRRATAERSNEMSPLLKQHAVGAWVRELRTQQGLSLRTLATRTDFSPSFISQVENGVVSPSISSMEKIANALGVTLAEFFAAAVQGEAVLIVRTEDRLEMLSGWSRGRLEALSPMRGRRQEPVLMTLEPGGRSGKHPYSHSAEEFAYVVEGEAILTLGPEVHTLHAGDAVTIRPQELRRWENKSASIVRVLIVSVR